MKERVRLLSPTLALAVVVVLMGCAARFLPHPPNFTPVGALAMFGGMYLPRRYAVALPLAAMFVSDVFIGFYSLPIMVSVYGSFALMGVIGMVVGKKRKVATVLGGTLLGSIFFFLITNAAVWAFGTMYSRDISGLFASYVAAIPFFRNSLAGDLFYVGVLVGQFAFLRRWVTARAHAATERVVHA